jgi:hypothetical protein
MTHYIPEGLNQQLRNCEIPAKFFWLYKDEMIISHLGNYFLFFFTNPTKPGNVQVWKKSYIFTIKQPVVTLIIVLSKPTSILRCLATQNLTHFAGY